MFHLTTLPPLSLYIHIPWCLQKCPYCDFNSHPVSGEIPEAAYITALLADLEQDLPKIGERVVQSIFIGGGTPSVLSPTAVVKLLTGIRARIAILTDAEITLEANPNTVDSTRFPAFREAGINRLSLGIQSFHDKTLQLIGRIHDSREAKLAIETVRQAGFENFNLDMMFGLPNQTLEAALQDLQIALTFQPPHLSWYQLTIEPNTFFYNNPPPIPDDDCLWEIQSQGQTYLAKQGFYQYEVSAYAKTGRQCQHNLNYWRFGDYLGIGAGAHSKITDVIQGTITRFSKSRHPHTYLQSADTPQVIAECTTLTVQQVYLEFLMNGLRLREGFTSQQFTTYTGLSLAGIEEPLQQAYKHNWLIATPTPAGIHFRTTEEGMRFLNEVLSLFVSV